MTATAKRGSPLSPKTIMERIRHMTIDFASNDEHINQNKRGRKETKVADIVSFGRSSPLTPIDVQTFSGGADRERLTKVALKAFRAVIEQWDLSNSDAAALLGVSDSTWDRIKRGAWSQPLSQDQLTRASAAIGVYKGLHLLFADGMADSWPTLPNRGPIFQRKSPVEAMIEGGIPLMIETRRYVDAVRGGM